MAKASDQLLSIFDRIYIINLPHRADRRREMRAELARIGLDLDHPAVTLFPASFPEDQGKFPSRGARGCFESHLGVHRDIVARGESRALLLEDDASFSPNFADDLDRIAAQLAKPDWDLFYSVVDLPPAVGDVDLGNGLIGLPADRTFVQAHFLGLSNEFSRQAADYLQAMYDRDGGDPLGGPMHVDGAYGWMRRAHPDLRVWASRKPLAGQRSSRSDIADKKIWDRLPVLRDLANVARRLKG